MTSAAATQPLDLVNDPVRVLVVDDSAVSRRLVSAAIAGDPEIMLAGTAGTGRMALKRIAQCRPDVVTLDIEMPDMGGMEALRAIRRDFPKVRIIVISSHTPRGSADSLEALSLGASECISKNQIADEGAVGALSALRSKLQPSIKQLGRASRGLVGMPHTAGLSSDRGTDFSHSGTTTLTVTPVAVTHSPAPATVTGSGVAGAPRPAGVFGTPHVFAIGISTGGPTALHQILPQIPAHFPLPILIVQHMPATFTKLLAERLQTVCALPVHEGADHMEIEPGHIYIAPGNYHMRVANQGGRQVIVLDQSAPEHSCRPAVDVLFRSLADVYRGSVIAAVLTGMGQDGQLGCEVLRASGAYILAQDEATSVVWGMPGGVARAGLADQILPLHDIIPDVLERCRSQISGSSRQSVWGTRK
ncbi:chemotaxis response regulator protein-glutamate methylesterase of group 1 operon [Bryobacterales bacterium F-183]|nr:chemotaxis response regulator protein-glutamate methylesterase of group 1 operon [Bryobacterales bacterium F-183]